MKITEGQYLDALKIVRDYMEQVKVETQCDANPILSVRLYDTDLSTRALNGLRAAEVETVSDLLQYTKRDLYKFRNLGRKSIIEIVEFLDRNGLVIEVGKPRQRRVIFKDSYDKDFKDLKEYV